MVQMRHSRFHRQFGGPLLVTAFVQSLGVVALVITALGVLWRLYARVNSPQPVDADFALNLVAVLMVGLVAGGLLLAAAGLLQYSAAALRAVEGLEKRGAELFAVGQDDSQAAAGAGGQLGAVPTRTTLAEMLYTLHEIRDLTLLPEAEREKLREGFLDQQKERVCAQVSEAIDDNRLRAARQLHATGLARFGPSEALEQLAGRIDTLDAQTEPLDYAQGMARVEEAIAAGDWLLAEQVAKALAAGHPRSERCAQLLEVTRRGRRFALVQAYTTQRRWSQAVAAAEEFISVYPDAAETVHLRAELGTLRGNAQIQRRKGYEAQIKDYVRSNRFAEALRLAQRVVESFPDSPQAKVLRKQIPQLQERAGGLQKSTE
ncbi:MAG: outer membrane protein assembly factor BamD [Phycisphaerae bacterium]